MTLDPHPPRIPSIERLVTSGSRRNKQGWVRGAASTRPASTLKTSIREPIDRAKRPRVAIPEDVVTTKKSIAADTPVATTMGASHLLAPATTRMQNAQQRQKERLEVAGRSPIQVDSDQRDGAQETEADARKGKPFAVSSVANNGRIYLRPSIRASKHPRSENVSPITPASATRFLESTPEVTNDSLDSIGLAHGSNRPFPPFSPLSPLLSPLQDSSWRAVRTPNAAWQTRPGHRRAVSDTTVPESVAARETDPGGLKIVITRPNQPVRRPSSIEESHEAPKDLMQISIPHWKLGTPRFSRRGTAFMRGSSYAPTEEYRTSRQTFNNRSGDSTPRLDPTSPYPATRRRGSAKGLKATPSQKLARAKYISARFTIEPLMFDNLTFKPACDARLIVRYCPRTGIVTAATPPRLVAEITSPSFVDYELVSDFFLTYRSFVEPSNLLLMLFARLRWALMRRDETGLVVKVRTFVALRHWILNYFVEDFLDELDMRVSFCGLLNGLSTDIMRESEPRKVRGKILAELNKCWRRMCVQYWDEAPPRTGMTDAPVTPGGMGEMSFLTIDPAFSRSFLDDDAQSQHSIPAPLGSHPLAQPDKSFLLDDSRAETNAGHQPAAAAGSAQVRSTGLAEGQREMISAIPDGKSTVNILSCTMPVKESKPARSQSHNKFTAHPARPALHQTMAEPIATLPPGMMAKRRQATHKRAQSHSNDMREALATVSTPAPFAQVQQPTSFAGDLVRGYVMPPGQPFVDLTMPIPSNAHNRQTSMFQPINLQKSKGSEHHRASAMSAHGMRKLIINVRRAWGSKTLLHTPISPAQMLNAGDPLSPTSMVSNRVPGPAIVPMPNSQGTAAPLRIDLLAATSADEFNKAIREGSARGFGLHDVSPSPSTPSFHHGHLPQFPLPPITPFSPVFHAGRDRIISDTGITTGSKSIVIVDDTALVPVSPHRSPVRTPMAEQSVGASGGRTLSHFADPTPPSTPPSRQLGSPRRSSQLLGADMRKSATIENVLLEPPPKVRPGLMPTSTASSDVIRAPSQKRIREISSRPPLSGSAIRARHRSDWSIHGRSNRKSGLASSIRSSTGMHSATRSFDATTVSARSSFEGVQSARDDEALRVLRRRPGGDLRAVDNVGDLGPRALRRSYSAGSLTTYNESIRNSRYMSSNVDFGANVDPDTARAQVMSLGVITTQPRPVTQLSRVSVNSGKAAMRPSFEEEAQRLAEIPDDTDDEGGVEAALRKLEGIIDMKQVRVSTKSIVTPADTSSVPSTSHAGEGETEAVVEGKKRHRHEHVVEDGVIPAASATIHEEEDLTPSLSQGGSAEDTKISDSSRPQVRSILSKVESVDSYSSIPLLQRHLTQDALILPPPALEKSKWTDRSVLLFNNAASPGDEGELDYNTISLAVDQAAMSESAIDASARGKQSIDGPPTLSKSSFLDFNNSDNESELSTELSEDDEEEDGVDLKLPLQSPQQLSSQTPGDFSEALVPVKNTHSSIEPERLTFLAPAESMLTPQASIHGVVTPDQTPRASHQAAAAATTTPNLGRGIDDTSTEYLTNMLLPPTTGETDLSDPSESPAHLPFILAFDSDLLAQQFTLIEKDALNEIDWKELIDMRWKDSDISSDCRSWVHFFRDRHPDSPPPCGVEVVIARFNLMVKWAVSEIVLTDDLEERARCVVKLIHIATACRRHRNYATMAQIVLALASSEITPLVKTWSLVPAQDLHALRILEALVSPTHNFAPLRLEMETVDIATANMGCIPFVGIYTHDLIFNSQRPSEIASSLMMPPLVNFERCRIAAGVVKTLLRLLEASGRYAFGTVEGVTERCLWMSALGDGEIRERSSRLE